MAGAGSNSTHTMTHVTDTNTPHPHTTTAPPHQPPTQRALAPQRHRQTTNHSHNTGQPSDRNTRTRTQPTTTEYSQPAAKRAPSTSLSSLNTSGFASPSPIVARRKPRTGPQVIQFTPTPNKTPRTQTHTHQHGEAGVVSAIESPTCAIDLDTSIHTHTYAHPHPHPPTHTTGAHGSADNRRLGHTANAPSGGESGQAHGAPISTPSQSRVRFVLSSQSSELPQRHKRRVGYRRVIADDDSCMENPTNASIGSGDAEAADTRVKCHADDRPSTDGDRMRRQSQSQRPRKKALKLKRGAAPANYTQALSIETIPKGPNSLVQYNVPFYVDPAQKALVEENKKNQRRRERKWKKVNDLLFDEFASESDGRGGRRNIDSSDDSSGSDSDDALESSFINDSYTQTQGSYQYRDLNKHMHEEDENESYAHQMAAAHGYGRVDTDAVVAKTVLPDTPQHNIRLHKSRFFSSDDDIDAYESEGIDDAEEDADTSAVLSAMDESTSLEDELADLGVDDDSWWVKAARREKRKKDSVNNATLARMRKSREQQQLTTARGASCKVTGPIVPDVRSVAGTYIIRIVQSDIHDAGRRKAIGHTMNQTLRTATHVHCVLEQSPPILPMDTLTTRFVASLIADVRIHVTSSDSKEDSQHIMDRIIRSLT